MRKQRASLLGVLAGAISACSLHDSYATQPTHQDPFGETNSIQSPSQTKPYEPLVKLFAPLPLASSNQKKELPLRTIEDITPHIPSGYPPNKDPLEDRFLRPLTTYDSVSTLAIEKLFHVPEIYLQGGKKRNCTQTLCLEGKTEEERQTILLKEAIAVTMRGLWGQYLAGNGPLAHELRQVDTIVTDITTLGSIKLDPRIRLNPATNTVEGWGFGAYTTLGRWSISFGYERQKEETTGREETRMMLGGEITF